MIVNKHKPWYKRGVYLKNKFYSISFGSWFESFGFNIKKNGGSLDISFDAFFIYLHFTFWDSYWRDKFCKHKERIEKHKCYQDRYTLEICKKCGKEIYTDL